LASTRRTIQCGNSGDATHEFLKERPEIKVDVRRISHGGKLSGTHHEQRALSEMSPVTKWDTGCVDRRRPMEYPTS